MKWRLKRAAPSRARPVLGMSSWVVPASDSVVAPASPFSAAKGACR
ncbi:hypothetical protein ACMS1Z_14865 [Acidiphilium multivorum]